MSLVLPNNGESIALSYLVNKMPTPENLMIRLFTNNITPGETDVSGTYTEASGNGYAAVELIGANWTVTPGAPTLAAYAQQTFTFTGNLGNVYGYFLTRKVTGDLVWAEKFTDGPYNMVNNGDQTKVTPQISID